MRRLGLVTMLVSIAALIIVLATGGSSDEVVEGTPGPTATPTPRPTVTPTPNPFTVETSDGVVTIARLSSPTPNTVRAEGSITVEQAAAQVTADGVLIGTAQIVARPNGSFEVDIGGLQPGPQEVCIADACQRVLVADPETESSEVIGARILQAIADAKSLFDFEQYLPEWTIEIAGANSATGGTAVIEEKLLRINANTGRTLDDYVITVLHEVAHGIDAEYLTDATRQAFRDLRGHDPALAWGITDGVVPGADRWLNSAEDFAEVFVAWALDGDYQIQSTSVAPQPAPQELVAFCELLALDGISCG